MSQSETSHDDAPLSGGCQCGAVRFRVTRVGRATICHCRMCQKAFGSFFGPFVTAHEMEWTRGAPKRFRSSDKVQRGFCAECGTPLTYEVDGGNAVELAIGAFDAPERVAPVLQVNLTDKLSYFDHLAELPALTEYDADWVEFLKTLVNHQHPDHDTAEWPQRETP